MNPYKYQSNQRHGGYCTTCGRLFRGRTPKAAGLACAAHIAKHHGYTVTPFAAVAQ